MIKDEQYDQVQQIRNTYIERLAQERARTKVQIEIESQEHSLGHKPDRLTSSKSFDEAEESEEMEEI